MTFALATTETFGAKSLIAGKNSEIFNFVVAGRAGVGTVVADKRVVG